MRAHVLVDKFDIVDGPGFWVIANAKETLAHSGDTENPQKIPIRFTVTTPASTRRMQAKVDIMCIMGGGLQIAFYFSGAFQGKLIDGLYYPSTKTGYFNEL